MHWSLSIIVCVIAALVFYSFKSQEDIVEQNKMSHQFGDSIESFGYKFYDDEKLGHIETGADFEFAVSSDHSYNQARYEALGELITPYVYNLLEKKCNLNRLSVPSDAKDEESTFVFGSKDLYTNSDKLLVLIHGSGVVRAGQWARRIIINDSVKKGTQVPYIEQAMKEGYAVLVMNTNDNGDGEKAIRGSESPEKHAIYIWKEYVEKSPAKHIAVVAHSYGGVCVTKLITSLSEQFMERVFAIGLTDSVHFINKDFTDKQLEYFGAVGRNWVTSGEVVDTPVKSRGAVPACVSAGHKQHEMTSYTSMDSVFKFFTQLYNK